jgi:uncharacterized membrane protein YadS
MPCGDKRAGKFPPRRGMHWAMLLIVARALAAGGGICAKLAASPAANERSVSVRVRHAKPATVLLFGVITLLGYPRFCEVYVLSEGLFPRRLTPSPEPS